MESSSQLLVQTSSSPSVLEASPAAAVHLQTSSSPSVMHSSLPHHMVIVDGVSF
jgi:hypothetical protein